MIHIKRGFIISITLVASVLNSSCSHFTKDLWEFTRSPVEQSKEKFSKVLLVENQENLALIGQDRHFIFPMTKVDNRFKTMLLGDKLRHFDMWGIYLEVDRSNSYFGRLSLKLNQSKSTLSQKDQDSLKDFCTKSELENGYCYLSIHIYGGHLGQEADFNRLKNENLPSIVQLSNPDEPEGIFYSYKSTRQHIKEATGFAVVAPFAISGDILNSGMVSATLGVIFVVMLVSSPFVILGDAVEGAMSVFAKDTTAKKEDTKLTEEDTALKKEGAIPTK